MCVYMVCFRAIVFMFAVACFFFTSGIFDFDWGSYDSRPLRSWSACHFVLAISRSSSIDFPPFQLDFLVHECLTLGVVVARGVIFSKWLWVLDCRGAAVRGAKAPIVSKKIV